MRLVNGKPQCAYCRTELDVPEGKQPQQMIVGTSGRKNVRALLVDGREIHRCEVGEMTAPAGL
jgi:hypothetical protein